MTFIDENSKGRTEALVGPLDEELLAAVDFYVARRCGIFVPRVEHCGHAPTPRHAHPAWLFFVHLNEKQVMEDFTTEWKSDGLTVTAVPAGLIHTEKPHELNARYAAVYLDKEFFARESARYPAASLEPREIFTFAVDTAILETIKEFIAEYEAALPGYDDLLDAASLALAHRLIRAMRHMPRASTTVTERMEIHKACDFIHEFYFRKLKVKDIAEVAAISESHFAHVFKRETGHSPADYVSMIRIDKAKKLLRAGELSVSEIADRTGFSSASHFSTAFAKATGTAPAEFRERGL